MLKSLFLFSDLAALTAKSENKKKAFQHQKRLGLQGCLIDMYNCTSVSLSLPGEQMLFAQLRAEFAHCSPNCRVNKCLFTWQPGK